MAVCGPRYADMAERGPSRAPHGEQRGGARRPGRSLYGPAARASRGQVPLPTFQARACSKVCCRAHVAAKCREYERPGRAGADMTRDRCCFCAAIFGLHGVRPRLIVTPI